MRAEINAPSKIFNWDSLWSLVAPETNLGVEVTHLDADEDEWKAGWNQYLMTAKLLQDTDFAGLENETCGPELIVL